MPIESFQYFIILFRVNQVFTFYHFIILNCILIIYTQLDAPKPARKDTIRSSGMCIPDAFYWSVTEVGSWIEDIGLWQYKVSNLIK